MNISVVSQVMVVIGAALTLIFTLFEINKKKLNKSFLLLGGLLTMLGGILVFTESEKSSLKQFQLLEDNKRLSNENTKLSRNNENLINKNISLTERAQDLIRLNTNLTHIVNRNTKEINNFLTSEDSYCYMTIDKADERNWRIAFLMDGKYPLFVTKVRVVDLQDTESFKNFNGNILYGHEPYRSIINNQYYFPLTMYPNEAIVSLSAENRINLKKETGLSLNIFFSTNRGEIRQTLRMKYNNGWKGQSIIVHGGKLISNKTDPGYPE